MCISIQYSLCGKKIKEKISGYFLCFSIHWEFCLYEIRFRTVRRVLFKQTVSKAPERDFWHILWKKAAFSKFTETQKIMTIINLFIIFLLFANVFDFRT